MQFSALLATTASLMATTALAGSAIVTNNCQAPIYLWSVSSVQGDMQTIQPGTSYSEVYHRDDKTGGIALKITRTEGGLFNGSPQLTLAYSLDGAQVWYDLSNTFGNAFEGSKLAVVPTVNTCPSIVWDNGVSPGGSQTKTCSSDSDVTLTTCA